MKYDTCAELETAVRSGAYDGAFRMLYPGTEPKDAAERGLRVISELQRTFNDAYHRDAALYSAPGRTEIGGNHTDHQHGHVLCASVNADMLACAAKNGRNAVRVRSDGYSAVEIALEDMERKDGEDGTSAALVRGVAAGLMISGAKPCGVDIFLDSKVPAGSGMSSSAAYEVLVGGILNEYWNAGLDAVGIAKNGEYSENRYFGKPSGLMDQMASAVGGILSIDFSDAENPSFRRLSAYPESFGYSVCLVGTGGSHADLTAEYASIPKEMKAVASWFGKNVLHEVEEEDFERAIPELRSRFGDRAVLRAMHFYLDDRLAQEEAYALEDGKMRRFLNLVNRSGISSAEQLQNSYPGGAEAEQPVSLALAAGRRLLNGSGAIRVHGGGFAGTVQAFVPDRKLDGFVREMERIFGKGCCRICSIRGQGFVRLEPGENPER